MLNLKFSINFLNNKAKSFIKNKIISDLDVIYPIAGECRYNYVCHLNSVHEAIKHNDEFIIMGFYLNGEQPIIHFYNYRNNQIIDNTLGYHTLNHQHYFYKRIYKKDFKNIDNIFYQFRLNIRKKIPIDLRLFSNYTC